MKKKMYVKPAMQIYKVEPILILSVSGGYNDHVKKRGDLYDGIPVNMDETCDASD